VKAYNGKPVLMAHPGKHPRQGFSAISFGNRNYMEVCIVIIDTTYRVQVENYENRTGEGAALAV